LFCGGSAGEGVPTAVIGNVFPEIIILERQERMVRSNRSSGDASKGGGKKKSFGSRLRKGLGGIKKKAKKKGKQAVYAGKVGKAAVQLAAKVTNPKNVRKMVKDAAKGKGVVLPGSNYIGPGNPMGRKVKSKADATAKKHDEDYGKYLKKGHSKKKVYTKYSDADARLKKASDKTTADGLATYAGMKAKQILHKTGLTGKRLRDSDPVKNKSQKKKKR